MTIDEKRPEVRRDAHITEPTDLKLNKNYLKKKLNSYIMTYIIMNINLNIWFIFLKETEITV